MKHNEPISAILHMVGVILSIAALTLMIIVASMRATPWHIVGFSIFGVTLILLYVASSLYHIIPVKRSVFLKIDHSMIYVLIAGTYTPICFVLGGIIGFGLFGVIWVLAILGVLLKTLTFSKLSEGVSTFLYIVMGWLIVVAFKQLIITFDFYALFWLVSGGVFYTIGAIFYSLDNYITRNRWFGTHEIFHIFVLAGSFSHFWLMLRYVVNV
ncbi:hemolysin III family protein [Candidatus Woesearchaeota archaeon]|nr:hemolysin III family protein [Candidatus Woesearchaeota archaeon]